MEEDKSLDLMGIKPAVKIDTALHSVEKNNKSLKGALPDNYFTRMRLDHSAGRVLKRKTS